MEDTNTITKDVMDWVGRREEAEDTCALVQVRRVAALLDHDPASYRDGDDLPIGWQFCMFTPLTRLGDLRTDGHSLVDTMMPPVDLPRRVLGGRRSYFPGRIRIGAPVRRVSEIVSITPKTGRTGRLVLVLLRHSIFEGDATEPSVVEEQDSIFREVAAAAKKPAAASTEAPEVPEPAFSRDLTFDPRMLFRYSAIGFNTHRIHYDLPYTTEQEGYPGLIVNGGLAILHLVEMLKENADRPIQGIEARNKGTIICGRPVRLCGKPDEDGGWQLWVQDQTSRVLLEARAT